MEKIKLVYQGAFAIPHVEDACVITLSDTQEIRAISILTDMSIADNIKFHQLYKDINYPHLLDVLAKMIREQGPQAYHIVFEYGTMNFKAKLVNATSGSEYSLPQDEAVQLAVAAGLEIFTDMEVLENYSTPFSKNVMSVALPIGQLPVSFLVEVMDKAVDAENNEEASLIRDELLRRLKEKKEKNEKNLND